MSIQVACQCGQQFSAKDELAGKRVRCPACQNPLDIPAPSAVQPQGTQAIPVMCQCGGQFQVPTSMSGQQVNCPNCGSLIPISIAGNHPAQFTGMPITGMPTSTAASVPVPAPAQPGVFSPHSVHQTQQNRNATKWIILGSVAGAALLGLILLIVGVSWIGKQFKKMQEALEPEWVADKTLVAELAPEEQVSNYSLRPMQGLYHQPGSYDEERKETRHAFIHGNLKYSMSAIFSDDPNYTADDGPLSLQPAVMELVDLACERSDSEIQGEVELDRGRIADLRFLRASYTLDVKGLNMLSGVLAGRFNRIWIAHDDGTRIVLWFATNASFDSDVFQLAEA